MCITICNERHSLFKSISFNCLKMGAAVHAVCAYGKWFPRCISPVVMAVVVAVSHVSFVTAQNVTPSSSQNLPSIHKRLWTIPVWTVTFRQWIFCLTNLMFWFNGQSEKKWMCDVELLHLTMRTIIHTNFLFIFLYLWETIWMRILSVVYRFWKMIYYHYNRL